MNDHDPEQADGTPRASPRKAVIELGQASAVVMVLAGVVYWWATTSGGDERRRVVAAPKSATGADYVGGRACRDCHPGEYALHGRSGHSRTLQPAGASAVARRLSGRTASDPEFPGVVWKYVLRDGRLVAERQEAGRRVQHTLDYAVGSGGRATTFVSLDGRDARGGSLATEHRLTHFTSRDALDVTPGQSAGKNVDGRGPGGRALTAEQTAKCLGCHATRLSSADEHVVDPATLMPNVSCERCHGPGRAHVAAARRGADTLRMPFGHDGAGASAKTVRLCGQCHRLPEFVPKAEIRPDNALLARFQPVGLLQSKCYTRTAGGLSCSACHDPHARASRDTTAYEAVCLSCHRIAPRAICPVSPRAGCLDCHMPPVDSGHGLLFTDHWIRIRKH